MTSIRSEIRLDPEYANRRTRPSPLLMPPDSSRRLQAFRQPVSASNGAGGTLQTVLAQPTAKAVFGAERHRRASKSVRKVAPTRPRRRPGSRAGIGTAWEKGERLAKLISQRRTLLVLDGLEPLQNPPGPQEGRVRDLPSGRFCASLPRSTEDLCVITTRLPIADVANHENTSAPRRDLEQLSCDSGAKLLRALGVKGDQVELRSVSDEFSGHCLALTLLASAA